MHVMEYCYSGDFYRNDAILFNDDGLKSKLT